MAKESGQLREAINSVGSWLAENITIPVFPTRDVAEYVKKTQTGENSKLHIYGREIFPKYKGINLKGEKILKFTIPWGEEIKSHRVKIKRDGTDEVTNSRFLYGNE